MIEKFKQNKLLLKNNIYKIEKEDIPCIDCGHKPLKKHRNSSGDDVLRCPKCKVHTTWIEADLEPGQQIKANIGDLIEATVSRQCRKCRENLEYRTTEVYQRFNNVNTWTCPNGCFYEKEFDRFQEFKLKEGKARVSIYEVLSSEG